MNVPPTSAGTGRRLSQSIVQAVGAAVGEGIAGMAQEEHDLAWVGMLLATLSGTAVVLFFVWLCL